MFRLIALAFSLASLSLAQGPLRFELKQIEKKAPGCIISFEYPEIISAPSLRARDRMNAGILRLLLRRTDWPAADSGVRSLDAYTNAFLSECGEIQKQSRFRDLYQHKFVTIFRYTPPILSFRCDADEDIGGAHPFGTTLFVNFESSTGRTVAIKDILREGALARLESIAEENFLQDHNLSPTKSLSEQGLDFPSDRFRVNGNFAVGETELVFFFNTYEIGTGAMGPSEIKIPYALLSDLLKPGLRLERP